MDSDSGSPHTAAAVAATAAAAVAAVLRVLLRPEADAASNAGAITDGLKHPPEASADPWLRLARRAREGSGRNVGQHPQKLKGLIRTNRPRVVAVGEMGLDYEQSEFCGRDLQADKDGTCR